MPNKLKELVSKKKIRYVLEGFDLDLTYITPRIIAMGFPAQSLEGFYRNHIDDVVSFFQKKHAKHYQIYNLCNERHIDEQKFEQDSINHQFPFNDHNPPMFSQMIACCRDIQNYLDIDENNIVAIQCKAGKGRTGVIVCACLLQIEMNKTATEILDFYGHRRTTNGKGVTIPSQIRYIYYFEHFLRKELKYESISLELVNVVLDEMPFISGNNYEIQFIIYVYDTNTKQLNMLHTSQFYEARKDGTRTLNLSPDSGFIVKDDLKFQFVVKSKFKKENLCHLWLNTFFIVHKPQIQSFQDGMKFNQNPNKTDCSANRKTGRNASDIHERFKSNMHAQGEPESPSNFYKLRLQKHEIDKACKDSNNKTFPSNFAITINFKKASKSPDSPTQIVPQPKPRTKQPAEPKHGYMDKEISENTPPYSPSNNDILENHSVSSESSSNSHCEDII